MQDNLYAELCSMNNLAKAWTKARKGKTKRKDVVEFEENIRENLLQLRKELIDKSYMPEPLTTFILRDPKTRRINKSVFRDRIVHHALHNIIEPIFEKIFIHDTCANRKCKGTLFAIKRFDKFKRIVTNNLHSKAFCLKADIKHYFQEVNHEILIRIIQRRVSDSEIIWLIEVILKNFESKKGMPLGNLTSQFFANVYLHELDFFVKHKLGVKYYIRYVDDFVILYFSQMQLSFWNLEIEIFLKEELNLEFHPDKSKIINLSSGIDFVGFRNFFYFKLLRNRSIRNMKRKVNFFNEGEITKERFEEIFSGWVAYAKWADTYNLMRKIEKISSQ